MLRAPEDSTSAAAVPPPLYITSPDIPEVYSYPDVLKTDINEIIDLYEEFQYTYDQIEELNFVCLEGFVLYDLEEAQSRDMTSLSHTAPDNHHEIYIKMLFTDTYPMEAPIIFLPELAGVTNMQVDNSGQLNTQETEGWLSSPILVELVESVIAHIGDNLVHIGHNPPNLGDSFVNPPGDSLVNQCTDKPTCGNKSSADSSAGINSDSWYKDTNTTINETTAEVAQKNTPDNSVCSPIQKHEPQLHNTHEVENLQNKENLHTTTYTPGSGTTTPGSGSATTTTPKDTEPTDTELYVALTEELEEYRADIEDEIAVLERENRVLSEENEVVREELQEVQGHISECRGELQNVQSEISVFSDEKLSRLHELSIDEQVQMRDKTGNSNVELKARVAAISGALGVLTSSLEGKVITLPQYLSNVRVLGREVFLARYTQRKLRDIRRSGQGRGG